MSGSVGRKLLSRITASGPQGTYWPTIVSLKQVLCNPYRLPFYTALEADAKISCLMCSASRKSTDMLANGRVLHSSLLVAITNSEARADDYLFTHARRLAPWCKRLKMFISGHGAIPACPPSRRAGGAVSSDGFSSLLSLPPAGAIICSCSNL